MFRYNMQSGQPRGSYPQSATPSAKAVKALTNVVKPGSIAKITSDGFASKRIGDGVVAAATHDREKCVLCLSTLDAMAGHTVALR